MLVEAQVTINGSMAAVWAAITNIENAAEIISGIEHIEVVEKPANGLVGLRWRETRILFGKPATVEKWITDAAENELLQETVPRQSQHDQTHGVFLHELQNDHRRLARTNVRLACVDAVVCR